MVLICFPLYIRMMGLVILVWAEHWQNRFLYYFHHDISSWAVISKELLYLTIVHLVWLGFSVFMSKVRLLNYRLYKKVGCLPVQLIVFLLTLF